jgi:hypothetical protein
LTENQNELSKTVIEILDYYVENTGISLIQRLICWYASIIAYLLEYNKVIELTNYAQKVEAGNKIIGELKNTELK